MSSLEGDGPKAKYQFKGKFGPPPKVSAPVVEASKEEIDAFVQAILGLTKAKEE